MSKINYQERDERCRLVKCPNYQGPEVGNAVNSNPMCEFCTGPVEWTDASGVRRGSTRACTSCPMNGRELPVCWAGCPGPSECFGTYGQCVISTGALEDEDGFIERYAERDFMAEKKTAYKDLWQKILNDEGAIRPPSIGKNESRAKELFILQRLIEMDGRTFAETRNAAIKGESRKIAELLKMPLGLTKGVIAVMGKLENINASQWDILRYIAKGVPQAKVASMIGVRKQAVNQNLKRMVKHNEWVVGLVGWGKPKSKSDMRCIVTR